MTEPNCPVAENLRRVRARMLESCARCGRDPAGVRLVAVSKTVDTGRISRAVAAGVDILGENYIQEAREKIPRVDNSAVSWHYIGHLQTNKAKYAAGLFAMVHSLDSLPLARALDREATRRGRVLPVLVQVNVSGEQVKSGVAPGDARALIEAAAGLPGLSVQGLMTMPPLSEDPEASRPYFRELRRLRDDLARDLPEAAGLAELSMGMSSDFEVAIEEGATLIRVGTLIFGHRLYT